MDKITITYYGHACFRISYQGSSVILDPYQHGSVPGLELPSGLQADAVYCSHAHADHNARNLVALTGREASFAVSTMSVPHDEEGGRKRGMCLVTMVGCGGLTLAHLGDIGRLPTLKEYEVLRRCQVLFVPCGGFYTIGPEDARTLIRECGSPLAILMHFRTKDRGYEVLSDITQIRKVFGKIDEVPESEISFDASHVPHGVITLEPLQD